MENYSMKNFLFIVTALSIILSSGSVNAFTHDKLKKQLEDAAQQLGTTKQIPGTKNPEKKKSSAQKSRSDPPAPEDAAQQLRTTKQIPGTKNPEKKKSSTQKSRSDPPAPVNSASSGMTVANSKGLNFDQKITILYQSIAVELNAKSNKRVKKVKTTCALKAYNKIRDGKLFFGYRGPPPEKKHVRSFEKYLKKINSEKKLKTLVNEYYKVFQKPPVKQKLNKKDAKFFGMRATNPVFKNFNEAKVGLMPCYFGGR